jgi:hypothetical protein
MKPFPHNADLLAVAPRVLWFEPPGQALSDPLRFMAYLMTYGTIEDIAVVKRYVGEEGFKDAIENAPAGIIDERSWAYWNAVAGNYPPPPPPQRKLRD